MTPPRRRLLDLYPITTAEIRDLEDTDLHLERRPLVTPPEAVQYIKENLKHHPGRRRVAALENLKRALLFDSKTFKDVPSSDFALAIFNDLDLLFYNGYLRNQVCLRFNEDVTQGYGLCVYAGRAARRTCIFICASKFDQIKSTFDRLRSIITVLIHEMGHAYMQQRCSLQLENAEPDPHHGRNGPGHGLSWCRILAVIQRRLDELDWGIDLTGGGQFRLNV